jgi:predicted enzyme related to lactoylglutathione lyase
MSATLAAPPTVIGKFVWRDNMSTDPAKAKAFYAGLFGWDVRPTDMGTAMGIYDILSNAGQEFGGIVSLDPAHGVPSHWISYIFVASVDEAAEKAAALGGTVHVPPTDIPGIGRFAVVSDPQGALFSPYSDATDPSEWPAEPAVPPVGTACWNELITADPEDAQRFYGEIFGWTFETSDMAGFPYTLIKRGEVMEGGLLQKPDEIPVSSWLIYYHVADLDQSLADVSRLGGQPLHEIITVPTVGRISWAMDPAGAVFALLEPEFQP